MFPWTDGLEESQRCGLVLTLPDVGDTEEGQSYATCNLQGKPMVTWFPAGSPAERFCVVFIWGNAEGDALQPIWIVADIPGPLPDDDIVTEACCYGLAGNHAAIGRGTPVVSYDAPQTAGTLMVLLFKQHQLSPTAPTSTLMSRDGFSIAAFAQRLNLGELMASRAVCFSATQAPVAAPACKPLAHCFGGVLNVHQSSPSTLTAALQQTAHGFPDRGLTIYDKAGKISRMTFSELWQRSMVISRGLGVRLHQGCSSALLQVPQMDHHFAAFWGCILHSVRPVAIAIPTNYGDGAQAVCKKIRNAWELLDAPPVISTTSHTDKVALLRVSADMDSMEILTVEDLEGVGRVGASDVAEANLDITAPGDVAFYQLSSGSTGIPKCIQITHAGVVAHIHGESQFCSISSSDVHVSFLPLDHVVPILTVHCCDVYHGCEEVQADVAWAITDPLRWLHLLSEHRATRTWAPNFAFKLIADALKTQVLPRQAFDLSCCRWWMNAGEQVTIPVCEDFLDQTSRFGVQRSTMQPAFGMAEACTCMTYNNHFDTQAAARLGRSTFVSLGPPVPGVEIRITDDANRTVREEVIGRFQIRGAVVTPGYVRNEEANQASFVGDGWFNTGDIGFIKEGCLFLTGREKEMIIIRGANFYCYEIEDIVNALPSVTPTFTAVVAAHDPHTGTEGFAVFCVPREAGAGKKASPELAKVASDVRGILVRHVGLTPSHIVPLLQEEFPKTTSGKIQRSQLARSLQAGEFDALLEALSSARC